MSRISLIAALLLLSRPHVALRVTPQTGFAPLTVHVQTTIDPDAANREACLFFLSDIGEEAESCWPVNGTRAQRTEFRQFILPAGLYEFGLWVERGEQPERVTSSRVRVTVVATN